MIRTTAPEFAAVMPRPSDDPMFRIQQQAENRARRNGRDPAPAGRKAMALRKLMLTRGVEPNPETILCVVAGEFRRA